jgi:uncharacterized protein YaaW (UPF0174 family)
MDPAGFRDPSTISPRCGLDKTISCLPGPLAQAITFVCTTFRAMGAKTSHSKTLFLTYAPH